MLGKGSYGTVYRAKRYSDGKLYALKEADVAKMSAIERKDAVNEIRLMASIKHENIVRYHEAILDGEISWGQTILTHAQDDVSRACDMECVSHIAYKLNLTFQGLFKQASHNTLSLMSIVMY